jgi:hypothetical protein
LPILKGKRRRKGKLRLLGTKALNQGWTSNWQRVFTALKDFTDSVRGAIVALQQVAYILDGTLWLAQVRLKRPGKGSSGPPRKVLEEDDMQMSARRSSARNETFIVRTPRSNTKPEDGVGDANVATIILPDGKTVHALDRAVFDRAVKRAFEK